MARPAEMRGGTGVPRPDDLEGWKAADRRVVERFDNMVEEARQVFGPKPVRRYFRSDDLKYYFEEHQQRGVIGAYLTWVLLDYREGGKGKTHAERMIEKGLGEAEETVLRAMMKATPSIHRVAGHDAKAGTVTLEDVLLGGEVAVRDRLMSEHIRDGIYITARVYPVGAFTFLSAAGPPLGMGMIDGAIDFLEREEVEFTREGLKRDAHKLGWLWKWSDEWEAKRQLPELRNTDQDRLVFHKAVFSVADEADARRRLAERKSVEHSEELDEYLWVKRTGRGARMLQGPVNLAYLRFKDGELEVEANSVERFEKIRGWLEKMPGVALKKVELKRTDEMLAAREGESAEEREDDDEDMNARSEVVAQMQEYINKHYMGWLDEKLPIYGGKTPRQMCRTEEGRRRVAMEIRTIPEPSSMPEVKVPRDAMRKELGLPVEARSEASDTAGADAGEEDSPLAPMREKVGRNAPCPCGSGKKYKKCCGR